MEKLGKRRLGWAKALRNASWRRHRLQTREKLINLRLNIE